MAFGLNFGGSASKSDTKQNSSSTSTTTGSEATNQTTQRIDQSTIDSLTALFKNISGSLGQGNSELSKEQAITDTQGVVKNLFDSYSKTVLPQIMQKAFSSGGYSATAATLLANDAFAQTVNKSAEVQLGAISQYEAASSARDQVKNTSLATVLQTLLGSKEVSNLVSSLNSTTNSSATSRTTGKSKGAGFGLSFP